MSVEVGGLFIAVGLVVPVHVRVHSWGEKEGNEVQMFSIKHRAAELQ